MAFRDEKITKEKALEIENAGVQIAYVKAQDEKIVKVISNGMVDIKAYVDFDAEAECGIRENVRFDVLCEILDAAQNEEELKEMLTDRADELTPNHITKDDILLQSTTLTAWLTVSAEQTISTTSATEESVA